MVDWRDQFKTYPLVFIAVAAGGFAFTAMLRRGRRRPPRRADPAIRTPDRVKPFLAGMAMVFLTEFIETRLPGLNGAGDENRTRNQQLGRL
jgi:hypothetical protein